MRAKARLATAGLTALAADGWRWLAGLATRPGAAAAPTADAQPVKSNP